MNTWSVAGRQDFLLLGYISLSSFFLLLGVHKPSKEQEGTNNLLFRCGETGTGQVVVIAMSSRPSGEPAYIVGRMVELT